MIVYQDAKLTLDLFETDKILFASWPGYENSNDFESAMQALLECLQVHGVSKLLMDARFYHTSASDATNWLNELLYNTFPKTNLQKIARLAFPDTALETTLLQVISSYQKETRTDYEIATFDNTSEAFAWLRS